MTILARNLQSALKYHGKFTFHVDSTFTVSNTCTLPVKTNMLKALAYLLQFSFFIPMYLS